MWPEIWREEEWRKQQFFERLIPNPPWREQWKGEKIQSMLFHVLNTKCNTSFISRVRRAFTYVSDIWVHGLIWHFQFASFCHCQYIAWFFYRRNVSVWFLHVAISGSAKFYIQLLSELSSWGFCIDVGDWRSTYMHRFPASCNIFCLGTCSEHSIDA